VRWLLLVLLTLAALLAAALAAALWFVEPRAAGLVLVRATARDLGVELVVDGPVGFHLLPVPQVSLARVQVAGAHLAGRIDRVDAVLDPSALLWLSPRVFALRLVRPDLTMDPMVWRSGLPAGEITLLDGRIALRHGRTALTLESLEAHGISLPGGRFELRGRAEVERHPLHFELSGENRPARVRLRSALRLGREGGLLRLQAAGELPRVAGAPPEGELRIDIAQPAALAREQTVLGLLPVSGLDGVLARLDAPLTLAGRLRRENGGIALAGLQLATGDLALSGSGRLEGGDPPRLRLELAATALALPEPFRLATLGSLRGLDARIRLEAHSGRIGPLPAEGLGLALHLFSAGGVSVERLAARVPGNGTLEVGGSIAPDGSARLQGTLLAERLGGLLRAAGFDLPLPPALAERPAELQVACETQPREAVFRCGRLVWHGGAGFFEGALERAGSGEPLRLSGRMDRLDLDPWLALPPPARTGWLARLAPFVFDLAMERAALGRLHAQKVRARGVLERDRIRLDQVWAEDVAGGRAELSGAVDAAGEELRLEGRIHAPTPARLWPMLSGELPAWLVLFDATDVDLAVRRGPAAEMLRFAVQAPLLRLVLLRRREGERALRHLELQAPVAEPLLRRLGVAPPDPAVWRVPLALRWMEERDADGPLRLEAAAAGGWPELRLELARGEDGVLAGTLTGAAPPTLSALETLWTGAARLLPLPADPPTLWPGNWPDLPLDGARLRRLPPLDLEVRLGSGLRGKVRLREGELAVDGLRLAASDFDLAAGLRLQPLEEGVALTLQVHADVARIRALPRLARLLQRVDGQLALDAELRTGGAFLRGLVRGLSGRVRFALRGGRLVDLRWQPALRTLRSSPGEALALADAEGACALEAGIARCRVPFVRLGEAGVFDVELEADLAAFTARLRLAPAGGGPVLMLSGPIGALAPTPARRAQSEGPSMRSGRTMASNASAAR